MAKKKTPIGGTPGAGEQNEHQEFKDKYGFEPTLWTELVGPAGSPDATIRYEALGRLLEKYQAPLKAFLRAVLAKRGIWGEDSINECFHEFVHDKIMRKDLIRKADRNKGHPFRNFLTTCLGNYAKDWVRGEGNRPPTDPLPPGIEGSVPDLPLGCDIEWAHSILQQALAKMFANCLAKKQQIIWTIFERRRVPTLLTGAEVEKLPDTIEFVRRTCGVTLSDKEFSSRQKTGEFKFAHCVRDVLSEICRDAEEIESEMQVFIELLRAIMQGHARE